MARKDQLMTPTERQMRTFAGLRKLVATLRGPDGCPWDRAQSHLSLRHYMTEEASETIDAIDEGTADSLKEELGDLLLQILLHTQIAEEDHEFRMGDVIGSIAEKLVRRHPHVFAEAVAETPDAVIEQWDDIKREERSGASALTGIPSARPDSSGNRKNRPGRRSMRSWRSFERRIHPSNAALRPVTPSSRSPTSSASWTLRARRHYERQPAASATSSAPLRAWRTNSQSTCARPVSRQSWRCGKKRRSAA